MQIDTLEEIKEIAKELILAKKKLSKLAESYFRKLHAGNCTRATTTTYNANAHSIVQHIIEPNERRLKDLLK